MKKKFNYSWVIVVLCFMCVCTSLGLCSSGRTMYLTAITDALGITRGAFSLNDTFRYVTTTTISIFLGRLINKFGTKKLLCFGFACLISFALINSMAEKLWLFYIGGVILGIGLSLTGTAMMSVVVNRWCDKNKGAITGAILAANGLGGAVAVQILTPIIFEENNPFGYRNSYRLVAIVLAVMLALVLIFFREMPKGKEKTAVPIRKKRKARGTGWVGMDFSEARKKPYLYLTLICMAFTGMSLQGLGGISTPHMYDLGIDKTFVASVMTVSSLCLICSKFLCGFLYDKLGMRITMNICLFSSFISLFSLVFVSNTTLGLVLAVVRVIFAAIALPLETVMLPLFASELFGNKSFDKTVGLFTAASSVGFALGSPFANICHDIFHNYNLAFIIFGLLMLFTTITLQFILTLANRDKKRIILNEKLMAGTADSTSESIMA